MVLLINQAINQHKPAAAAANAAAWSTLLLKSSLTSRARPASRASISLWPTYCDPSHAISADRVRSSDSLSPVVDVLPAAPASWSTQQVLSTSNSMCILHETLSNINSHFIIYETVLLHQFLTIKIWFTFCKKSRCLYAQVFW